MSIDELVQSIAAISLPNVFNPYSDVCEIHDNAMSPIIRCQNLKNLLQVSVESNVSTMWFGRDLGYLGGRRTGVALTDEIHLSHHQKMFRDVDLRKATKSPVQGERTANMTWDYLNEIREPVFLWNIFPFHPHEQDNQLSNRCHTKKERHSVSHIIKGIIDLIAPEKVIAIGNDSYCGLSEMEVDSIKVRHPSYGGKSDFVDGLNLIYGVPIEIKRQKEFALH